MNRRTDNDDLTVTGLSYGCCDRRSRPPADLQWLTFWHDERIEFACQRSVTQRIQKSEILSGLDREFRGSSEQSSGITREISYLQQHSSILTKVETKITNHHEGCN